MTQQPPPNQQGGYYHSQYSQQPSYQEPSYQEPSYPEPSYPAQQPPYPQQQSTYPQQSPQYPQQQPQQYPQHSVASEPQAPQAPYAPAQPYEPAPYGSQPYSPQPYAPQPQPGYGGQPPYGDQPGYFPGAGAPQPPPKRSKKLWGILGSVAGGLLLLGGLAVVRALLGEAANEVELNLQVPEVGECITEASLIGTETEVVDCGSAEAAWEVIGNDGTWTEADFDATPAEGICTGFEGTEQMLWIGEITDDQSGDGEVVCLVSVAAE